MNNWFKSVFVVALWWSHPAYAQTFAETDKIVAIDRGSGDMFGYSVSISGNYAVVGAQHESEDTNGLNTLAFAGAAYIFEKSATGNWIQVQKLVPADRTTNDFFGASVCIDGNTAIVGAYEKDSLGSPTFLHAGAVYVFERDAFGTWNQVKKLVASDPSAHDHFGYSVSISGDYIVSGCPIDAEDALGGNPLTSAGSAYVFERISGEWTFKQKIVSSDRDAVDLFGYSVSVNGNYAIVGAYREDEDASGGNTISDAGSAYIFERNGLGNWIEVQKIVASDRANTDRFGIGVTIYGNYALVGAYLEDEDAAGLNTLNGSGSAYMFERNGVGIWNQTQKLVAPDRAANDNFGTTLCINGNVAIVGVPFEDEDENGLNTIPAAGSAYIYQLDGGGTWQFFKKIVSSDRASSDYFGFSVSVHSNQIIASAYLEDEDAQGGNSLSGAGSAYIFQYCTHSSHSYVVNACYQYTSPSGNYVWTTSGTYADTIPNSGGCDSVLTITVNIKNTDSTFFQTSCQNYVSPSGNYIWSTSGTYMDTLLNAFGCDSVLTIHLTVQTSYSSVSETSCVFYVSPSGNYTWTTSDTYTDTIPNTFGCDSVITVNLTILNVDTNVVQTNFTLTAQAPGATYQWLDCDNGNSVVVGETNSSFSPTVDGNYAVQVTQAGCTDTSNCHEVIGIGWGHELENPFVVDVYPNPTDACVYVQASGSFQFVVRDIAGRVLQKGDSLSGGTIKLEMINSGTYILCITTSGRVFETRLMVQK